MQGLEPTVHAKINGSDALLVADSGAFFSFITPGAVKEYGLSAEPQYHGLSVRGVGGLERAEVARAKSFAISARSSPALTSLSPAAISVTPWAFSARTSFVSQTSNTTWRTGSSAW